MNTITPSTQERILHQGLALLSQAGLAGVTLGVLADRVGLSKSGLFAHFRSKEDVQLGLLTYMGQCARQQVVEAAMRAAEGLPRLQALVELWLGWAPRAGLPGGCPVAAALFELDDVDGPVRQQVLAMEREWRDLLTQLVRQAIARGHMRPDLDVEQFVWELCGIYLSHHAAQRFLRATDADARAQTAFQALLARAQPPRACRRRGQHVKRPPA
jgi:AcrR family transcriptional regulator